MIETDEVIVTNRKARHDYQILETMEVGIVLKGSEVKSLRDRRGNLNDSFARIFNGEVILFNMHISPYPFNKMEELDPLRERKLLLHKHQITKLIGTLNTGNHTLIPLKLYFKKGKVKVDLGLAKGKTQHDKRDSIREKEQNKEMRRHMGKFR